MIKLGDKVKDKITGLTGTATARVMYLNGCVQFLVLPRMAAPKRNENPKYPEGFYIDAEQLVVVSKKKKKKVKPSGGGVRQHP